MASLDDLVTVGNSFNKNLSQLVVALQNFQALYQGVIDVAHGGTGRTSLTSNNVLLGNGTSPINFVAPGTSGNVLTSDGTTWNSTALPVAPANVSSIAFGTTGLTPAAATTGAVSVSGTLVVGNGGTGKTSFTTYGVVCGGTTATGALQNISAGTSGQVLTSAGAAALPSFQTLNKLTQVAAVSTSGSATIELVTGIPSWARRVTIMFSAVSTSGTSDIQVQAGTSGGYGSTTYSSASANLAQGSTVSVSPGSTTPITTYLAIRYTSAADLVYGIMFLSNISGNDWAESHSCAKVGSASTCMTGGGRAVLNAALDRVRLVTATGAFDGGSASILYE